MKTFPGKIERRFLLLIGLFLLLSTSRTLIWGDAALMCTTAGSVITKGSFDIPAGIRDDVTVGRGGLSYAKYPLLAVLQCVPMMAMLHLAERWQVPMVSLIRLLGNLPLILLSLLLFIGLWRVLKLLEFDQETRIWISLLLFFSTPIWVHSRTYYAELLQTTLVAWFFFYALESFRSFGKKSSILAGVFLGLAFLAKSTLILLGLPFFFYFLWGRWKESSSWRKVFSAATAFLPFLLIHLGFNFYRHGDVFVSGYGSERDGLFGFGTPLSEGLFGLLFSSGKSIFLYAPILLSLFFLRKADFMKWKRELLTFFGVFFIFLIISAKWWSWAGDWAWGPRLIVPLLPLFALPLALVWKRSSLLRKSMIALGCLGILVQLLGVLIHPQDYLRMAAVLTRELVYPNGAETFVRDDLIFPHFVPAFSPIAGHFFLILAQFFGRGWAVEHYPWKNLSEGVSGPKEYMFPQGLDLWPTHDGASIFLVAFLLGAFLGLQVFFWIKRSKEKVSD